MNYVVIIEILNRSSCLSSCGLKNLFNKDVALKDESYNMWGEL